MSDPRIERALEEFFESERLSRRGFIGRAGSSGLALTGLATVLAACGGVEGEAEKASKSKQKVATVNHPKTEIGDWTFANWPLYIDKKVIKDFNKQFGGKCKYVEEINDNNEFFGKVRQQYARGDSGGRDLHAVTDWMAARMIRLGYVQKLDKSQLPNVQANLLDALKHPDYDKNRDYGVPWQGIQAGIIYRKDKVKRAPKSVNDIFDPAYKGKTTMLTEMRDSVGLVMLGMGKDPETGSLDDMLAAVEKIDKASKSGQIRRFTGNEYIRDLPKGDSWLIYGWSGDAVSLQADNPNIAFVAPEEGFTLSYDIMQIPVGAPHAFTAEKMIDFVYQPEIQAPIAEYVNYVTPVKGVKEILQKKDPKIAENPLIFPPEEIAAKLHPYPALSPKDEQTMQEAMAKVTGA